MKRLNKKKLILLILLLIAISGVGVTLAYFISNTYYVNEFNSKKYNVKMTDDFDNEWGKKIVSFTNEDNSTSVFLRIRVSEEWNSDYGILPNVINGNDTVIKTWGDDYSSFVLLNDGYYYYKKVLNENETVSFLKAINKNDSILDDRYKAADYDISIYYEAIQSTCDAAKSLWKVDTCTLSGTNVSWE